MQSRRKIGAVLLLAAIAVCISASFSISFDGAWFRESVMSLFSSSFVREVP